MKLQTAIVGATGYAGMELTRLLLRHPRVQAPVLFRRDAGSGRGDGESIPWLSGNGAPAMEAFSLEQMKERGVGLAFLATPHAFSRALVPKVLEQGIRVIDLSGAWR